MKKELTQITQITQKELQHRVIYSLFLPVVRLARVFGMTLKDAKQWMSIAYMHELKNQGLNQEQCAQKLGVSRRTIIDLSKRLKENFFLHERHQGLGRRILFILWAGEMPEGRLIQALSNTADVEEVKLAIATLISENKIEKLTTKATPHYALKRNAFRLYMNSWIARVDALNNQMSSLCDVVFSRFFTKDPHTFTRTVGLSIRKSDRDELEKFYKEVIFPKLEALDAAAAEEPDTTVFELSISWVSQNFIEQFEKQKNQQGEENERDS